jgi:conjugal transfer ATP-binding protein TraC
MTRPDEKRRSFQMPGWVMSGLAGVGRALDDKTPPIGSVLGRFHRARLSQYLPYRYWDEDHELFLQDRSLGFVLEITPLIGGDETTGRLLAELFTEGLPQGAVCQVISYASPKIGPIVDGWAMERARGGAFYEEMAGHRREHFRKAAFGSGSRSAPFFFRDFRVFLSVEKAGASDPVAIAEMCEIREKFVSSLTTLRTSSVIVHPDRLIGFLIDLLNPTRKIQPAEALYDPGRLISDQIIAADTRWTRYRERIVVQARGEGDALNAEPHERELAAQDDVFEMRGFSVLQYPDAWSQGLMSRTLGDMFNDQLRLVGATLSCLVIRPEGVSKSKSLTEFNRMRSEQSAQNPLTKAFPAIRKKAEDWAMVAEDVSDGALLGKMALFMVSIAPVEDGERAERALRAVYRAARFNIQRDDDIHIQTVLACLPLTLAGGLIDDLGDFGRLRMMPTTVASRIAPLQGEYLGSETPHMLLVGRRGQPFYWSNFSNDGGNYNAIVVGSSGSGKSVFMQEMATSLRGAGCEVFVVDDGRSFMSSCLLQGGAFIRFSLDLDVCLNPFSMADHQLAATDSEYLVETKKNIAFEILCMCRGSQMPSKEEEGIVDRCVSLVWDTKGRAGDMDDIRDVMLGRWFTPVDAVEDEGSGGADDAAQAGPSPDAEAKPIDFGQRGRDLALSLTPYTSEGTYGAFFNGPATLEITNPYTVFEMGDLESKPDLRAVVVLAVMFLVRQRMRMSGRQVRKALIIDEAWSLLADGAMGAFIEGFARRCRKEGGAIITGTQGINDYYKTSGANACLQNSDWQVFLRLKPEALEQARKDAKLSLDEAGMQLLKSLRTSTGEYSEAMIQGPNGRAVGRLVLDPFAGTLYSTTPAVYNAIEQLVGQGHSLQEAVRRVAFKQAPLRASAETDGRAA